MTECNWDSPHCILLSYPDGSRGKVVAVALGLSQHCLLQTAESQGWSREQKWQFLRRRLMQAIQTGRYSDFDLKNSQFVGTVFASSLYGLGGLTAWHQHYQQLPFNPAFVEITHREQDFVVGSHNSEELQLHTSHWRQARTVRCTHGDALFYARPPGLSADLFSSVVQWEDRNIQSDHSFDLRTVWHEGDFIDAVRDLYEQFAYQDFDLCRPYLEQFRTMWTRTVNTIARSQPTV